MKTFFFKLFYFYFILQQVSSQTCTCVSPTTLNTGILASAATFTILAKTTVTNTGATTVLGSIGVSPGTTITGSPTVLASGASVVGPSSVSATAQTDLTTAYTNLRALTVGTDLSGQNLGGKTLVAGVYGFTGAAALTGILKLDAAGVATAQWTFLIATTLTANIGSSVSVINGGSNFNVYWVVTDASILANSIFIGNIIANNGIVLGNNVFLVGRALAIGSSVQMDTDVVSNTCIDCV